MLTWLIGTAAAGGGAAGWWLGGPAISRHTDTRPTGSGRLVAAAATAALFAAAAWWAGKAQQLPLLPAMLSLAGIAVPLSVIDVRTHRLPDALIRPAYPVLAVLLTAGTAVSGDWGALGWAAVGAAVMLAVYLAAALIRPGDMGWGDVKLSGLLGAILGYLGWPSLIIGLLAGYVLAAGAALLMLAAGRANRHTALPLGPFMLAGTGIGIAAASALVSGVFAGL